MKFNFVWNKLIKKAPQKPDVRLFIVRDLFAHYNMISFQAQTTVVSSTWKLAHNKHCLITTNERKVRREALIITLRDCNTELREIVQSPC